MDLLGIPIRVVVGSKNLPNVEIKLRGEEKPVLVPLGEAASYVHAAVRAALKALEPEL
jgi:prolyl-tRNA synthetase